MLEQAVEDRPPIKSRVVPQFGLSNGRQAAGVNGNTLIECVPVIFDGWKIHHIRFDGAWIRQGTVIFKNAQISGQDSPATLSNDCPLSNNCLFQCLIFNHFRYLGYEQYLLANQLTSLIVYHREMSEFGGKFVCHSVCN